MQIINGSVKQIPYNPSGPEFLFVIARAVEKVNLKGPAFLSMGVGIPLRHFFPGGQHLALTAFNTRAKQG